MKIQDLDIFRYTTIMIKRIYNEELINLNKTPNIYVHGGLCWDATVGLPH